MSREIGRKRAVSRNANEFGLNAFLSLSNLPINRLILGNSLLIAPSAQIAQHLPVNSREWFVPGAREQVSTLFSRRQVVKDGRKRSEGEKIERQERIL